MIDRAVCFKFTLQIQDYMYIFVAVSYCAIAATEHGDVSKDDRRPAFLDG